MKFYSFNSWRALRQLFVVFCYFNRSVRYCIQTCLLLSLLLLPKPLKIKINKTRGLLLLCGHETWFLAVRWTVGCFRRKLCSEYLGLRGRKNNWGWFRKLHNEEAAHFDCMSVAFPGLWGLRYRYCGLMNFVCIGLHLAGLLAWGIRHLQALYLYKTTLTQKLHTHTLPYPRGCLSLSSQFSSCRRMYMAKAAQPQRSFS